jgi:sporulation protein YlmC with PRC-barrel domain
MLGSDLRGTRVYGANDENIGSINDVLVDRQGQLVAVIVGVGGFLGIGQKDVAVPFQALEIVANDRTGAAGTTGMTGMSMAGNAGTAEGAGTTSTVRTDPTTTGAVGTQGAGGMAAAGDVVSGQQGTVNPDRIVLRGMTKADLENAPSFRADGRIIDSQKGISNQIETPGPTPASGATGSTPVGGVPAQRQ